MKFDLMKAITNVWVLIAAAVILIIFIFSPIGKDLSAFVTGNACAAGMYYDKGQCLSLPAGVNCGFGTYYDAVQKGCKVSNGAVLVLAAAVLYIVYLSMSGFAKPKLRKFPECMEAVYSPKGDFYKYGTERWANIQNRVMQDEVLTFNAWLARGELCIDGALHSSLIAGDASGVVLREWDYPLSDRQIRELQKSELKLEAAIMKINEMREQMSGAKELIEDANV